MRFQVAGLLKTTKLGISFRTQMVTPQREAHTKGRIQHSQGRCDAVGTASSHLVFMPRKALTPRPRWTVCLHAAAACWTARQMCIFAV